MICQGDGSGLRARARNHGATSPPWESRSCVDSPAPTTPQHAPVQQAPATMPPRPCPVLAFSFGDLGKELADSRG